MLRHVPLSGNRWRQGGQALGAAPEAILTAVRDALGRNGRARPERGSPVQGRPEARAENPVVADPLGAAELKHRLVGPRVVDTVVRNGVAAPEEQALQMGDAGTGVTDPEARGMRRAALRVAALQREGAFRPGHPFLHRHS